MAKGKVIGGSELDRMWPDIAKLAEKLVLTAREHGNGNAHLAAMAMSVALGSIIGTISTSESNLREGLRLNNLFLSEKAHWVFKKMHLQ